MSETTNKPAPSTGSEQPSEPNLLCPWRCFEDEVKMPCPSCDSAVTKKTDCPYSACHDGQMSRFDSRRQCESWHDCPHCSGLSARIRKRDAPAPRVEDSVEQGDEPKLDSYLDPESLDDYDELACKKCKGRGYLDGEECRCCGGSGHKDDCEDRCPAVQADAPAVEAEGERVHETDGHLSLLDVLYEYFPDFGQRATDHDFKMRVLHDICQAAKREPKWSSEQPEPLPPKTLKGRLTDRAEASHHTALWYVGDKSLSEILTDFEGDKVTITVSDMIKALDSFARIYDAHEYGLPLSGRREKLREIVITEYQKIASEPSAAQVRIEPYDLVMLGMLHTYFAGKASVDPMDDYYTDMRDWLDDFSKRVEKTAPVSAVDTKEERQDE